MLGRLDRLSDADGYSFDLVLTQEYAVRLRNRLSTMINQIGRGKRSHDHFWGDKLHSSVSGGEINQVGNLSASSSWIDKPPPFWNGGDFVKAILLRGNLLPTVGGVHNPSGHRRCRAGCFSTESLSHVLQTCPTPHSERIRRQDRVVKVVAEVATKYGWSVEFEPRFRDGNSILHKPDLIARKGNTVVVGEMGISWEGPENLERAYDGKLNYYSERSLISAFTARYPESSISIQPIIIGARSGWCPRNNHITQLFGFNRNDYSTLICDVLKGSWIYHRAFSTRIFE